jgi:hypothetical protein
MFVCATFTTHTATPEVAFNRRFRDAKDFVLMSAIVSHTALLRDLLFAPSSDTSQQVTDNTDDDTSSDKKKDSKQTSDENGFAHPLRYLIDSWQEAAKQQTAANDDAVEMLQHDETAIKKLFKGLGSSSSDSNTTPDGLSNNPITNLLAPHNSEEQENSATNPLIQLLTGDEHKDKNPVQKLLAKAAAPFRKEDSSEENSHPADIGETVTEFFENLTGRNGPEEQPKEQPIGYILRTKAALNRGLLQVCERSELLWGVDWRQRLVLTIIGSVGFVVLGLLRLVSPYIYNPGLMQCILYISNQVVLDSSYTCTHQLITRRFITRVNRLGPACITKHVSPERDPIYKVIALCAVVLMLATAQLHCMRAAVDRGDSPSSAFSAVCIALMVRAALLCCKRCCSTVTAWLAVLQQRAPTRERLLALLRVAAAKVAELVVWTALGLGGTAFVYQITPGYVLKLVTYF